MQFHGFSSDELRMFYGILDRAVQDATARALPISVHHIIERLFEEAGRGERDPERLRRVAMDGESPIPF